LIYTFVKTVKLTCDVVVIMSLLYCLSMTTSKNLEFDYSVITSSQLFRVILYPHCNIIEPIGSVITG